MRAIGASCPPPGAGRTPGEGEEGERELSGLIPKRGAQVSCSSTPERGSHVLAALFPGQEGDGATRESQVGKRHKAPGQEAGELLPRLRGCVFRPGLVLWGSDLFDLPGQNSHCLNRSRGAIARPQGPPGAVGCYLPATSCLPGPAED